MSTRNRLVQSSNLNLETLEDRTVLSVTSVTYNAGMVFIRCNDTLTNAVVSRSGTTTNIYDHSRLVWTSGPSQAVNRVQFLGGAANDTFINNVSTLPIQAWGYGGNDYLEGYNGADILVGGTGHDTLKGYGGDDQMWGEAGNDRLFGGLGTDRLYGGADNDWLEAGSAAEVAVGDAGTDWNAHIWAISGATANDVRQQGSPTCSFLASLSSCAMRGYNLSNYIRYLGNYQYSVSLFDGTSWRSISVTFDGNTSGTDPRSMAEGESWTILFNRAYTKLVGGDGSSWPSQALMALTGRATTSLHRAPVDADFYTMEARLASGRNVVTATYATNSNQSPLLVSNHAYTVVSVLRNGAGGPGWVQVRNPWGVDGGSSTYGSSTDGYIWLTWAAFRSSMQGIWIN